MRNILHLRDEYKLFSRIAAMSSKTKAKVSNVFIYKKRDALKLTMQEYEDIRNLLIIFDIKDLPYLGLNSESVLQSKHKNSGRKLPKEHSGLALKATPH